MALSNELISQFVKVTQDKEETKKESTAYGKIVKQGDVEYVQLDGSDLLTPISSTTVVKDGDRVIVTIKNHEAIVTGDLTTPSANNDDVKEIGNKISEFEIVIAGKVSTEQLEAEIARIEKLRTDELEATNAKIETIEGKVAEIDNIEADIIEVNKKLTAHEGEFATIRADIADFKDVTAESVEAIEGDFHTLESDYADFKETTTNKITANEGNISKLETDKLDVTTAEVTYANIDFSNIKEAAIEKLFTDSGIIKDLIMSDGKVTGELVGVTIKGDLIEGNTLKADKLVILGEDGLYYKLNVNALGETTASSDEKYQNGLDGSVIIAESITAEKISVDDLVAFGATIGGYRINDHALYSGTKESVTNTTRGVFLGDDGQMAIGDSNNYLRYFLDEDGQYKLEIKANSLKLESSSAIGGRNLILDSDTQYNNKNDLIATYTPSEALVEGETYTCSMCINPASDVENLEFYLSAGFASQYEIPVVPNEEQIISKTFTASYSDNLTPNIDEKYAKLDVYRNPRSNVDYLNVENSIRLTPLERKSQSVSLAKGEYTLNFEDHIVLEPTDMFGLSNETITLAPGETINVHRVIPAGVYNVKYTSLEPQYNTDGTSTPSNISILFTRNNVTTNAYGWSVTLEKEENQGVVITNISDITMYIQGLTFEHVSGDGEMVIQFPNNNITLYPDQIYNGMSISLDERESEFVIYNQMGANIYINNLTLTSPMNRLDAPETISFPTDYVDDTLPALNGAYVTEVNLLPGVYEINFSSISYDTDNAMWMAVFENSMEIIAGDQFYDGCRIRFDEPERGRFAIAVQSPDGLTVNATINDLSLKLVSYLNFLDLVDVPKSLTIAAQENVWYNRIIDSGTYTIHFSSISTTNINNVELYFRDNDITVSGDRLYDGTAVTFTTSESMIYVRNNTENDITINDLAICSTLDNTVIKWIKVEKGDVASDWTPAPEDVDDDMSKLASSEDLNNATDSLNDRINQAQSTITMLSNMISHLVTDENGGSLMTQTPDGWTFNMSSINGNLEAIQQAMSNVKSGQDDTNDALGKLTDLVNDVVNKTAYVTISTDEKGDPCIELGKTDNLFKVRITNTAIDFLEGSTKIAYANNNTFYSSKIITKEIQIGEGPGFVWQTRANGNMGLAYIS